jgi:putative transposase
MGSQEDDLTNALEGDLPHGPASRIHCGLAARRMDDDGARGTIWHEPKTGDKWIERYAGDPEHGVAERSRAPHAHGRAMPEAIRRSVLALREAHPRWGPKKLRAVLCEREPPRAWPAASTTGDLLRREGVSQPRRRLRSVVPLTQPLTAAATPNDVWTADFTGWFRTADGTRCDPLTIADACSRFVFCCRIVAPTAAGVRP